MSDITLAYLIANNSELLPHIEERAMEISHHQNVMLQNVLPLPPISGWADRKNSAYLNTDVAVELQENTDIPISNLYRRRLATSSPKEWGSAYELTDRRVSSDTENVVAAAINSLGIALRRRIEQQIFAAAQSFINKHGEKANSANADALTLATLIGIAAKANHVATAPGNLLYVVHPYQIQGLANSLVAIGSSVTDKAQEGGAALANLQALPDLTNVALAIPNVGLLTVSHNMPRRLRAYLKIHGTAGTFRLQVGEGDAIVPTSDRSTTTPYNITVEIAGNAAASVIKTALDNLNQGTWTVSGTNTGNGFTIQYPDGLFLHDLYHLRVPVDTSAADNVTLDAIGSLQYIEKSKYDKVTGTSPYTTVPKSLDGTTNLGLEFEEISGAARVLAYKRNAIAFDPRTSPVLHSETKKDGRVLRYAYYQTFGVVSWEPRMGFTSLAEAKDPL